LLRRCARRECSGGSVPPSHKHVQAAGCPEKLAELQLSDAALRHSLIILRRNLGASAYLSKIHLQVEIRLSQSDVPYVRSIRDHNRSSERSMRRRGKQRDSHAVQTCQHPNIPAWEHTWNIKARASSLPNSGSRQRLTTSVDYW
jgi:hypothetical protein